MTISDEGEQNDAAAPASAKPLEEMPCPYCAAVNRKGVMRLSHDEMICDTCYSSFIIPDLNPLPRYFRTWNETAAQNYALLRPVHNLMLEFANPKLFDLLEEAYYSALIGLYNGSIVVLGQYLEALIKEVIYVNEKGPFKGAFGPAINRVRNKNYMRRVDIDRFEHYKNVFRNSYQHTDYSDILDGIMFRGWRIDVPKDGEGIVRAMDEGLKEIRNGGGKRFCVPASAVGSMAAPLKRKIDEFRCINLFNEVFDFSIQIKVRYLKSELYADMAEISGRLIDESIDRIAQGNEINDIISETNANISGAILAIKISIGKGRMKAYRRKIRAGIYSS